MPALAALLANANHLSLGWQIAVGIAGGVVGFLLPVIVIFAIGWLTAPTRQRNEAREAAREATETRSQARNRAYADGLSVKAEVDRRTGFAQRWLGDELALETLKATTVPMPSWDASKFVFEAVLEPDAWKALATVVDKFGADWDRLLTVANRDGPFSPAQHRALLDDLQSASENLIAKREDVIRCLQPLVTSGDGAGRN